VAGADGSGGRGKGFEKQFRDDSLVMMPVISLPRIAPFTQSFRSAHGNLTSTCLPAVRPDIPVSLPHIEGEPMANVIRFPTPKQSAKPDPSSSLMRSAAAAAVQSGLDRKAAADALRRVASALERRG
jgi:hypothetical protein